MCEREREREREKEREKRFLLATIREIGWRIVTGPLHPAER